jgi:hypothetical protein
MLANIRNWWRSYPWMAWYPGVAFFLAILTFNLLGEGLRRFISESRVNVSRLLNRYTVLAAIVLIAGLVWLLMVGSSLACGLVTFVIGGALHGGLMVLYLKLLREQPASVTDVFACFGPWFVQLMFVWVVSQVASGLGMFCLLPQFSRSYLRCSWFSR